MSVTRISEVGLNQILNNRVLAPVTCVIKFYSNDCHMCHSLQEYYLDVSNQYELDPNIVFYAYNVDDDPAIEKRLNFSGVPTIVAINPNPELPPRKMARHVAMPEPEEPNKKTWYKVRDIKNFIEQERIK
jgi:hypothetical protein|tara:strand:- start:2266 stop:2655 length:390 start_codon:yes stop_codon:yes gene_type:complete